MDPVDGFIYSDETKTKFTGAATGTKDIIIRSSVKIIKGGTRMQDSCIYSNRYEVESIIFEEGDLEIIENYAFSNAVNIVKIDLSPCKKLHTIGKYSFETTPITSLIFPQDGNLSLIDEGCFRSCVSLSKVLLPASLKELMHRSFIWCYNLSEVSFGKNSKLKHIGEYAFESSIIEEFTVPKGVTLIERTPFSLCTKLRAIYTEPDSVFYTSYNGVLYSSNETALEVFPRDYPYEARIKETVTIIQSQAFRGATITGVVFPSKLQRIESFAFAECSSLTSVSLPDTLTYIEIGSFRTSGLTSIVIPHNISIITAYCFMDSTSLTSVTFHDNITTIGERAFSSCPLTSMFLPKKINTLYKYAFRYCSKLEYVYIPNGIKNMQGGIFEKCNENLRVEIQPGGNFTSIDDYRIIFGDNGANVITMYANPPVTDIELNENVRTISAGAFSGRPITSITLGSGVNRIEERAFASCYGLTSIHIPSTITYIGEEAFQYASLSNNIVIDSEIQIKEIPKKCFQATGLTSFTVPSSIECLSVSAFADCFYLESLTFEGNGLKYINESCFSNCKLLDTIHIPRSIVNVFFHAFNQNSVKHVLFAEESNITLLDNGAFMDSLRLESVRLPDSLETIDSNCFMNCVNLKEIRIPKSLKRIKDRSFSGCKSVTDIVIANNSLLGEIDDSALEGMPSLARIQLGAGNAHFSVSDDFAILYNYGRTEIVRYCSANERSEFNIPNKVAGIRGYAFDSACFLKAVDIPISVRIIGIGAFQNCTSLASLNITLENTTIAPSAFRGCIGLLCGSVEYPSSLYESLVTSGIPEESLHKCITREFSLNAEFNPIFGEFFASLAYLDIESNEMH